MSAKEILVWTLFALMAVASALLLVGFWRLAYRLDDVRRDIADQLEPMRKDLASKLDRSG